MGRSLGLILALCLAGLQFIAILIVVSASYLSSERVLLNHARNLLSDVGANAIAHSQGFLDPAEGAAELSARLAENRIVASENRALLDAFLFQQLRTTPQFAGIFYGDTSGDFVYVMRSDGPGPYRSKLVDRTEDGQDTDLIWRDASFGEVARRKDPEDRYDPRTRPWYQLAEKQRDTVWTDPYVFFSSRSPGITIASPVLDEGNALQGVIGVDIEISAVSDFLSQLQIGENGVALIMNRNGDVIAHPMTELLTAANQDGTLRFVNIDEIEDSIARAAFGGLADREHVAVEEETYNVFRFEGENYVSAIMPIISEELPWTIAVYAPEDDFLGDIKANRSRDIAIAGVVSLLTAAVGLFLANYIKKPVEAFAVRAALVSQGEIDPSEPMPSTYRELEHANETLSREILQRKRSERTYGQTFELASRGMVQVDPETGSFLRVNASFANMMGYSIDEMLSMNAQDIAPEHDTSRPFPYDPERPDSNRPAEFRTQRVRKDGTLVWVKVNSILIRDDKGAPLHVVATIDDITNEMAAEKQIQKLNRELSHLGRGELLGQMAAGLAHELNQPLTAITQNADAALSSLSDVEEADRELRQILGDLEEQAHRAADVIKALRNFAKKGESRGAPFDLEELVAQSMRLVQPDATEAGVDIEVSGIDEIPPVFGIRVQVAQVLINLLRNAIEAIASASSNERKIAVSAEVESRAVHVCVADTGPGVNPDLDLFTQFETTKEDGMGLGLSICRSLIEAGGGKMWHEADPISGARFHFTVPLAP